MKIAVLHGFFDQLGGAEKIALSIARYFNADLLTTNFDQEKINLFGFSNVSIKSIGNIAKKWPEKHFEALEMFKKVNLENYDVIIITSEWALPAAKNNIPSLFYVNSLPRDTFDFSDGYLREKTTKNDIKKLQKKSKKIKIILKKYIFQTNIIACNSNCTQRELIRNIKRDSVLLYPSVDTKDYFFNKYGDFWLSVNRIDYYKRINLQLETFSLLPEERLVIVGDFNNVDDKKYINHLNKSKPSNVSFIGRKDGKELKSLYAECKGFIATAKDEYFGLTVIEAMASGKPVVAVNEGGYKETVAKNTGILVNANKYKLAGAVKEISSNSKKYKEQCIEHALKFSSNIFYEKIDKIIKGIL